MRQELIEVDRFLRTILIALSALPLMFCSAEGQGVPAIEDREVYLSKEELEFTAEGGSVTIHVTSEFPWEVIVYDGEGWVDVSPVTSSDESETTDVAIKVSSNKGYESRAAEVVFSSEYKDGVLAVTQSALPLPDECCQLSSTEAHFNADRNDRYPFFVTTYNEDVLVSCDADWLVIEGAEQGFIPALTENARIVVGPKTPNTAFSKLEANLSFRGKDSGKLVTATVTQDAARVCYGFPARWEYVSSDTAEWPKLKLAYANAGSGKDAAYFHVVSVGGSEPSYSSNFSGPAYGNMGKDDYVEYCVPVTSLEAGTRIDFYTSVEATGDYSPKYWIFEYWDEGRWNKVPDQNGDLKTADDGTVYSYYMKYFDSYQIRSFLQSFTLKDKVENDYVRMRCRVAGNTKAYPSGYVFMRQMYLIGCVIEAHQPSSSPAVRDITKLGVLGNSFTYCYSTFWMLKSIARSQGHELVVRANIKGSQTFGNHLSLEYSRNVYEEDGYDYVLIQDQSTQAAVYMSDPSAHADIAENTQALASKFKEKSPDAKVILEATWSYPMTDNSFAGYNSYEEFDRLLQTGTDAIAAKSPAVDMVSPIGKAFAAAREQGINMYRTSDKKHQSREGAYLKSCVNYLMIFGEPFSGEVENCGVSDAVAAKLRAIAEAAVLSE